jgi:hypothetical protein
MTNLIENRLSYLETQLRVQRENNNHLIGALRDDITRLQNPVSQRTKPISTPGWTMLTVPLTSTDWDGDSYSDVAVTTLDLSTVFGAPAGVKAVLLEVLVRDSAAAENTWFFSCGPSSTWAHEFVCHAGANDVYRYYTTWVPCDSNGDFYYNIDASGTGTLDIYLRIYGYYI